MLLRIKKLLWLIINIPYVAMQWNRTFKAQQVGDWEAIERLMLGLHGRKLVTEDSLFTLGCAQMRLEKWDEALLTLRSITKPLDDPTNEAKRWVNEAIALVNLGEPIAAADLMASKMKDDWPHEQLRKARVIIGSDTSGDQ